MSQPPLRFRIYKALKRPLLPIRGTLKTVLQHWKRRVATWLRAFRSDAGFPIGQVSSISDWTGHMATGTDRPTLVMIHEPTVINYDPSCGANGTSHPRFVQESSHQAPATFLASIPQGRLWGSCAAVLTPDGQLVADLSTQIEAAPIQAHEIFEHVTLPSITHIDGTVAVLVSPGSENYFHWMCDAAPRFGLLKEVLPHEPVDFYALPKPLRRFQREVLSILGIGEEKFLLVDDSVQIQATRLLVPSLPGRSGRVTAATCRFLRNLFPLERSQPTSRRLYISRENSIYRRVADEEALVAFLHPYGFESVALEKMSVAEQSAMFAEAEIVFGPHGAGMTNVVFCSRGTKVIELFSPHYVNPCYRTIAHQVGLLHFHVLGRGKCRSDSVRPDWGEVDIEVDYAALDEVLAQAGVDRPK